VRVDFHTHTTASDGALTPAGLVDRAVAAGVRGFAITDHDTLAGYRAARRYCLSSGIDPGLVSGVELSGRWGSAAVHIVGLGVAPEHPVLTAGLEHLARVRRERAAEIAGRLAARGIPGALEGASAQAGESQIGRPHFAAWMVEAGHVRDTGRAFRRFLGQGRIGDVKACWPPMAETVQWIIRAGGLPVLAHPLKYRFTRTRLRALVADFVAAGGGGIEVICGGRAQNDDALVWRLAREFALAVSAGSDFHADTPWGAGVGVEWRDAAGLVPVWEQVGPARLRTGAVA